MHGLVFCFFKVCFSTAISVQIRLLQVMPIVIPVMNQSKEIDE